ARRTPANLADRCARRAAHPITFDGTREGRRSIPHEWEAHHEAHVLPFRSAVGYAEFTELAADGAGEAVTRCRQAHGAGQRPLVAHYLHVPTSLHARTRSATAGGVTRRTPCGCRGAAL